MKLDEILKEYELIVEKVDMPVSRARASFRFDEPKVKDHDEFKKVITAFVQHMQRHIYHGVSMDDDMAYGTVRGMLEQTNRDNGGYVAAAEAGISGHDSGMQGVLNQIAGYFRQDLTQKYITHVIDSKIPPLDFDEIVRLIEEFLKRFGHLLPSAFSSKSPAQLAPKYKDLLLGYLSSVRKIKSAIYKP